MFLDQASGNQHAKDDLNNKLQITKLAKNIGLFSKYNDYLIDTSDIVTTFKISTRYYSPPFYVLNLRTSQNTRIDFGV